MPCANPAGTADAAGCAGGVQFPVPAECVLPLVMMGTDFVDKQMILKGLNQDQVWRTATTLLCRRRLCTDDRGISLNQARYTASLPAPGTVKVQMSHWLDHLGGDSLGTSSSPQHRLHGPPADADVHCLMRLPELLGAEQFELFLRALYSRHIQSHQELDTGMVVLTRAQVQLALCTKKKWKWPSQAMLHSAWNDIVFNMKYWTSLQDQW